MPGMSGLTIIEKLRDFIEELNLQQPKIEVLEPEFVIVTAFVTNQIRLENNTVQIYEKPLRFETLENAMIQAKN